MAHHRRGTAACGRIAQLAEQLTLNQRVLGSSPSAPTNLFNELGGFRRRVENAVSALCWHPPGAERRTIIRTIIAAALAAVLATPAAAHIPDGCESQFWALKYASATLRMAHEAYRLTQRMRGSSRSRNISTRSGRPLPPASSSRAASTKARRPLRARATTTTPAGRTRQPNTRMDTRSFAVGAARRRSTGRKASSAAPSR